MKRIFSLLLIFLLLPSMLPIPGFAARKQLIPVETDLPGSDELFAGYVEQVFYGGSAAFGTAAGRQLTGDYKLIYDALVPVLKQIAAGARSDTVIRVGQSAYSGGKTYTPEVSAVFTGRAPDDQQMMKLIFSLLSDLPYELYWFDKTTGFYYVPIVSSSGTLKYIEIGFVVADNYKVSDYETNTAKTSAAARSAANARSIVSRYASASDYGMLKGYCDEICNLVDYDYDAAYQGNFHEIIDPWQLISVFDGDPSTNVVCEGYSKAFMYLCDQSRFSEDTMCITVSGQMNGGAHMWNTVVLDGRSYLLDVTNCDTGWDLFLIGGLGSVTGGYLASGISYSYDFHTIQLWGGGSSGILSLSSSDYVDHSFGNWVCTVSPTCVQPGTEVRSCTVCSQTQSREIAPLGHSYGDWIPATAPTCSEPGTEVCICTLCSDANTREVPILEHSFGQWVQTVPPTIGTEGEEIRECTLCGHTETRTLEVLQLAAPQISSSVNTRTGKPRISWDAVEGADFYRVYRSTRSSGSFTYLKSTSSESFTDTSAKVGVNYYYKVRSVDQDYDKLSGFSNIVNRVCDLKKPVVTMKVQTATGKPKLTWEGISGSAKYRIYRSTKEASGYSLLKTTTSTTYIDTSAKAGTNYYYKVKALHTNSSADSAYSEAVNRLCDLAKPVVTITRSGGDPKIRWDTVPGAQKYYIYRSTSKSGDYTHVKTAITARTYTDTSAKAGRTYYYKVKAIHAKSSANSAYSDIKYITAK